MSTLSVKINQTARTQQTQEYSKSQHESSYDASSHPGASVNYLMNIVFSWLLVCSDVTKQQMTLRSYYIITRRKAQYFFFYIVQCVQLSLSRKQKKKTIYGLRLPNPLITDNWHFRAYSVYTHRLFFGAQGMSINSHSSRKRGVEGAGRWGWFEQQWLCLCSPFAPLRWAGDTISRPAWPRFIAAEFLLFAQGSALYELRVDLPHPRLSSAAGDAPAKVQTGL